MANAEFTNSPQQFFQNKLDALEETRKMSGLSRKNFKAMFEILDKSEHGMIEFQRGNTQVTIRAHSYIWRVADIINKSSKEFEISARITLGSAHTTVTHELSSLDIASFFAEENYDLKGRDTSEVNVQMAASEDELGEKER